MRKSKWFVAAILVTALMSWTKPGFSQAESVRTWTTTDGETLNAVWDRMDESKPGKVCLICDGEKYIIALEDLSKQDQEYIQKKKQKPNVKKSKFVKITETKCPKAGSVAGERKVLNVDGIEYAFRWCPPGEFTMGTPKEPLKPRQPDVMFYDKNPHKVKLTQGFWLLETEVTQEMWQSVMGTNPSKFKGNRKPVEQVSWNDCQAFCQKLSEKLGQQVQLPSEAQWEYACRAGSTGSYAGDLDSMAWYYDNSSSTTHAVGKKQSNAWGLYDMHGNVSEWCFDAYDPRYYDDAPTYDPVNTNNDEGWGRVVRGGSWNFDERFCRSTDRHHERPDCQESKFIGRPNSIGLRLAIVPSQEE